MSSEELAEAVQFELDAMQITVDELTTLLCRYLSPMCPPGVPLISPTPGQKRVLRRP